MRVVGIYRPPAKAHLSFGEAPGDAKIATSANGYKEWATRGDLRTHADPDAPTYETGATTDTGLLAAGG